jgi:hypothetical protein
MKLLISILTLVISSSALALPQIDSDKVISDLRNDGIVADGLCIGKRLDAFYFPVNHLIGGAEISAEGAISTLRDNLAYARFQTRILLAVNLETQGKSIVWRVDYCDVNGDNQL